jgi:gamma-glutamyl phosphate reductase
VDAKINSPSACNAAETLLLHHATLAPGKLTANHRCTSTSCPLQAVSLT